MTIERAALILALIAGVQFIRQVVEMSSLATAEPAALTARLRAMS